MFYSHFIVAIAFWQLVNKWICYVIIGGRSYWTAASTHFGPCGPSLSLACPLFSPISSLHTALCAVSYSHYNVLTFSDIENGIVCWKSVHTIDDYCILYFATRKWPLTLCCLINEWMNESSRFALNTDDTVLLQPIHAVYIRTERSAVLLVLDARSISE